MRKQVSKEPNTEQDDINCLYDVLFTAEKRFIELHSDLKSGQTETFKVPADCCCTTVGLQVAAEALSRVFNSVSMWTLFKAFLASI